jgi:hypothetical protein
MKDHEATYILDDQSTVVIDNALVEAAQQQQYLSVLHKQLVISLKFHHAQTLSKMPLELAVQAITEVWKSCNQDDSQPPRSGGQLP